ncbi:peptidoglycan DD-metalloendopeptidase family protein [Rhodococcus sp. KBS0724]|nr:peptidoglycan DD-metalloendopeptidase family protein [Rhodococcus sp. KBS0724]
MGKHRKQHRPRARRFVALAAGAGALTAIGTFANTGVASAHDWSQVAMCESSGNWSINTGNGFYGGLQFTQSTWDAYKPEGAPARADMASIADQVAAAEATLDAQGIGAWPVCGAHLGWGGVTPGSGDVSTLPSAGEAVHVAPAALHTGSRCNWEWPVDGAISQGFHAGHDGADFAVDVGTVLHAPTSGTISVAGPFDPGGYGTYIQLEADTGEQIQMGHLSETWVSKGTHVQVGDEIGATGNTGSSTGPHLHLRIHSGGAVDPVGFLKSVGACNTGASVTPAPIFAPALDAPAPKPVESAVGDTVTVSEGDTLFDLASTRGKNWQEVWAMNAWITDPDQIFVGDVITF